MCLDQNADPVVEVSIALVKLWISPMSRLRPNPEITKVAVVDNKFNVLDFVKPAKKQGDVKAAKKMTKANGSLDTAI